MSSLTSKGTALTVRMLPSILRSLNLELAIINNDRQILFQNRILNKEIVVNLLLQDYLSLEQDQRREILKTGVRNLETRLLDEGQKKKEPEDFARLQTFKPSPRANKTPPKLTNKKPIKKKST